MKLWSNPLMLYISARGACPSDTYSGWACTSKGKTIISLNLQSQHVQWDVNKNNKEHWTHCALFNPTMEKQGYWLRGHTQRSVLKVSRIGKQSSDTADNDPHKNTVQMTPGHGLVSHTHLHVTDSNCAYLALAQSMCYERPQAKLLLAAGCDSFTSIGAELLKIKKAISFTV